VAAVDSVPDVSKRNGGWHGVSVSLLERASYLQKDAAKRWKQPLSSDLILSIQDVAQVRPSNFSRGEMSVTGLRQMGPRLTCWFYLELRL